MARHGKRNDETNGNPVLRLARGSEEIDQSPERIAKDVKIINFGWNNTDEGKADLKSGRKPGRVDKSGNGKHSKTED